MKCFVPLAVVGVSLVVVVSMAGPPPPLPRVCGLTHEPMGAAAIFESDLDGDGASDRVTLSNIGSSGQDGVKVSLSNVSAGSLSPGVSPCGWTGAIDFGPAGDLPVGQQITITARDTFDNPIPGFVITETNSGDAAITLANSCIDCTVSVQAYRDGIRVADLDGDGLSDVLVTGPIGTVAPLGPPDRDGHVVLTKSMHKRHHGHVTILKLAGSTNIVLTGSGLPATAVEADSILVEVHHELEEDDTLLAMEITASNTGGHDIIIDKEGMITCDVTLSAAGGAHLDGFEMCAGSPPPVCENGIAVSNIGSSGQDGVSILESPNLREGGHTVGAGQVIEIVERTLDPGDEIEHCIEGHLIDGAAPVLVCSKATGFPGGALSIEITDTSTASDQYQVEVFPLGVPVLPAGPPTVGPPVASVSNAMPGTPVMIGTAFGMSRHMKGEHMLGAMWKFGSDCRITPVGGMPVIGDEIRINKVSAYVLKKEEGGRHTPFHNKMSAPGGGTIEIKNISPAEMGFSQGYAFGLHHQSLGDAQLYVRDFSSIELAPDLKERGLTVSGGGGAGGWGVSINLGQADSIRLRLDDTDLDGLDSEIVGKAKAASPGNRDVYVWKVKKSASTVGPSDAVDISADFTSAGSSMHDVVLYLNGAPVTTVEDVPNNTAVIASSQPRIIENKKGLMADFLTGGGEGELVFLWDFGVEVQVGGQLHMADAMAFRAHEPTVSDHLAFLHLTAGGEVQEFTILDESLRLFDMHHTGSGSARILGIPGSTGTTLQVLNPSSGALATMASNYVRHIVRGLENYRKDWGYDITVTDPCAGLPKPCGIRDGASLSSTANISVPQGERRATVEVVNDSGGTDSTAISIEATFAELGYTTFTVEVLNGNVVVGTVFGHSGPIAATCSVCDLPWPSHLRWNLSAVDNRTFATVTFDDEHLFDFGSSSFLGDGVRLIIPAVIGFYEHELRTMDIPEVLITNVTFENETQPLCRADIAPHPGGNGIVGVPDLLAVINGWGPCPAPPDACPADIAPEPAGNGIVGVPDLLYIINNWGPCSQ